MKRFTLLLITVILSLNCMAQSDNTTTIKLHQGEFINQSHATRIQQTNETLLFDKMTNEYVLLLSNRCLLTKTVTALL